MRGGTGEASAPPTDTGWSEVAEHAPAPGPAEERKTLIHPARHPDFEPTVEPPVDETLIDAAMAGEPGPRGSSAVGGFLWTTLAWGGNRVVIFVLTLVLARLLTPEDFGLVTAALTLIAMLDAALDLGVGAAVVADQERGISRRTRTAGTLNLIMSAVVAGVGIAASPLIAACSALRTRPGCSR